MPPVDALRAQGVRFVTGSDAHRLDQIPRSRAAPPTPPSIGGANLLGTRSHCKQPFGGNRARPSFWPGWPRMPAKLCGALGTYCLRSQAYLAEVLRREYDPPRGFV